MKAKRFINALLVNRKGTKTGFCCSLVPRSARWAHGVCWCVCGMLACWTAGVWSYCHRRCLALLINSNKNSFVVRTPTNTHTPTFTQTLSIVLRSERFVLVSTFIRVSGKATWTLFCLSGFDINLWLVSRHVVSLQLRSFLSTHQRGSLFFLLLFFYCSPPFHSVSKRLF